MSKIRDDEANMTLAIQKFDSQRNNLKKVSFALADMKIDGVISGEVSARISSGLKNLHEQVEAERGSLSSVRNSLERIQQQYHNCENELTGNTGNYHVDYDEVDIDPVGPVDPVDPSPSDDKKKKPTRKERYDSNGWDFFNYDADTKHEIFGNTTSAEAYFDGYAVRYKQSVGDDTNNASFKFTVGKVQAKTGFSISAGPSTKRKYVSVMPESSSQEWKDDNKPDEHYKTDTLGVYGSIYGGASITVTSVEGSANCGWKKGKIGAGGAAQVDIAKGELQGAVSGRIARHNGQIEGDLGVSGDAMVSAVKGKAEGSIDLRWAKATASVEGHAGAFGASGYAALRYRNGEFTFKVNGGAAAILGVKAGATITINFRQIADDGISIAKASLKGAKKVFKGIKNIFKKKKT